MDDPIMAFVKRAQSLRKRYNYWLQTSSGLGHMLAGGICILVCVVNWLIGSGLLNAVIIFCLVLMWIAGKEVIKRHYCNTYEDDDVDTKHIPWHMRVCHGAAIVLTGLFALDWWAIRILSGNTWALNHVIPLVIISVLPWITKRYLRSPIDFVAGFFLWVICAAASTGLPLGLSSEGLSTLLMLGLALIVIGGWDHLEYCQIVKEVKELRWPHPINHLHQI